MSALTRIRRGWHLGSQSLRIVFRDKTLLLFPMIPFTVAIALIVAFISIIGSDQLFWALFLIDSFQQARSLVIGYAIVAIVSVYFSTGLVACTRITLDERDSKLMDGLMAAVKKIHWVVLWALIAWTIGPVLNLLDHLRFTSPWVRKIVKTNWSQLSFFLLPVVIVDNINVFSAIRRAIDRTNERWGAGAVSRLGLVWFFLIINIPTLLLVAIGYSLEGPWPRSMTFVVLAMLYLTVVVYQSASAVLGVVLYKYATDGTVVPGFKAEWMKGAFTKPKVYVLVDDSAPEDEGTEENRLSSEEVETDEETSETHEDTETDQEDAAAEDRDEASPAGEEAPEGEEPTEGEEAPEGEEPTEEEKASNTADDEARLPGEETEDEKNS